MNVNRDRSFDQTDEERDRDALERLLGGNPESSHAYDGFEGDGGSQVPGAPFDPPPSADPTPPPASANPPNSTMPVGGPRPTPTPTATTNQFTPQITQGFRPNHAMEGFDFNREQNTGRSAKDAFAFLANQAPPPPTNDKNALAQWFNQHIRPGMDALGHHVSDVNGDTFTFDNWQGQFTVDYGRGAGAEGGALAWQVDPGTAQMPDNPTYSPGGSQGARTEVSPVAPPTMPLTGGGENPTAMEDILAEIEALMSGRGSPMDSRALQGLLQ